MYVIVIRKNFYFLDPMSTGKIQIQDILACDTVVASILIDLNGFRTYENREVLVTDIILKSNKNVIFILFFTI